MMIITALKVCNERDRDLQSILQKEKRSVSKILKFERFWELDPLEKFSL